MAKLQYLIVGAGVTGATIARLLTDAGRMCFVVDARDRPAGNVADAVHGPSNIRRCLHGPHYFRTNSEKVWEFANRFAGFHPYRAVVKVWDRDSGTNRHWPLRRPEAGEPFPPDTEPENFTEAVLSKMNPVAFLKYVAEYTEKQWGVPCRSLSAELAKRVVVREDENPEFSPHNYQGIPLGGYSAWVEKMLDGIPVRLGVSRGFHTNYHLPRVRVVWTGPIDEYFEYEYGRLEYRAQFRIETHINPIPGGTLYPCGQINFPRHADGPHVRCVEWKHMLPMEEWAAARGTLITTEIPRPAARPDEYEYPVQDLGENAARFQKYRELAGRQEGVTFAGRLGRYRYMDMDQAVGSAMAVAEGLLSRPR